MPELAERAAHAVRLGAEELFGRQRDNGAFGDDPPPSVLGTAGAITALWFADRANSAELIAGGSRWLRSVQQPDGGWGGVLGAGSEPVATAVATAALQIVDPGASTEAIAAGRARLEQFGGITAVTDPAVLLLCKTFYLLAGFLQPSDMRRLPLEIVLFDKVRRERIGFRTAPFAALALAQSVTDPAPGLRGRTARLARGKALGLLRAIYEHEGRTGDFSEDPWPAALVCLSLARAGLAPDLVAASAGYLRRSVRPDGSWDAVSNLDLTRSGYAVTGLVAAGYAGDPRLEQARQLFHRCQQQQEFTVLACPPGGWSFSGARGWPVTLESAEIVAALAGLPGAATDPVLRTGVQWLRDRQDSRGSWSLWVRNTKLANDGPCPSITSQAIVALLDAGLAADSPEIGKAAAWLATQQRPDGTFDNLWYRDYTTGTAAVLAALARAGRGSEPVADRARQWLAGTQRPDGSWGDGADSDSSVEETAWALNALLEAGLDPASDSARRAVSWLVDAQLPTGGWQPSRICAYIRHHMYYPNGAITRGLALRALGLYSEKTEQADETAGSVPGPAVSPAVSEESGR
ncbi:prenyltransferase/squalene oxidase repeat-containing protein [Jatrophihabitans sp.]|uniref:prenyltransferase/squalene oxidase repeat-containing protein n=1 Tax=Jatrophihabitans sp. TaxID=1932789 RepID=UPI002BF0FD09|nr:prenyltransferase/squalene oxidase repeat-containing protein [Jatrophihabitans sp.]